MEPLGVKTALEQYFDAKANQREQIMRQRPHDTRNTRCAASLRQVIAYINGLQSDHPHLLRLTQAKHLFEGRVFIPLRRDYSGAGDDPEGASQADRDAFQCGFHAAIGSPDAWFDSWVRAVLDEGSDGQFSLDMENFARDHNLPTIEEDE